MNESLLKDIHSIDNLNSYCSQDSFKIWCESNQTSIAKHFLDIYKVDYKDPNNFIYKFNRKNISEYKNNLEYNLQSILKLYMETYDLTEINCKNMMITTVPILPNMNIFKCMNNQLTTFPIQPKMQIFYGQDNQLTTFPIQPKMIRFYGDNNQLTTFPIQPEMLEFSCNTNHLTIFSIQPKMKEFLARDNQLTSFRSKNSTKFL